MKSLPWIIALSLATQAFAELSMPNVFSDHMVLQTDKPVKLWGKADPNAKITAQFGETKAAAQSNAEGSWSLTLPAMKVNAKGDELQVTSGNDKLIFKDVLVGEVWHASGQSNMQRSLRQIGDQGKAAVAASDVPTIRFFQAKKVTGVTPQEDVEGTWKVSHPNVSAGFSAVAWFFAHRLHQELGVPVGIVQTAWGGQPVETFTRREALLSIPEGKSKMEAHDKALAAYDAEQAKSEYEEALKKYEEEQKVWDATPKEERKGKGPRKPSMAQNPGLVPGRPTTIWNGMVAPVAGFTQRGAIWYQGESNQGNAADYGKLFALKIQDWRKVWGDDFTYLWVQLADYKKPVKEPGTNAGWAVVQEHQRRCLSLPKTGMAVINDIGDARDIHPKNKKDVGERLARWALAEDYGKDVVKCGPLYKEHKVEGDKVIVSFECSKGLKSRDGGELKHFEIQDEAGKWHWADASIAGETVVISHQEVKQPKAARYAWAANPAGSNLVNGEGLPASLFTTEW